MLPPTLHPGLSLQEKKFSVVQAEAPHDSPEAHLWYVLVKPAGTVVPSQSPGAGGGAAGGSDGSGDGGGRNGSGDGGG